jgi:hypothetical protein
MPNDSRQTNLARMRTWVQAMRATARDKPDPEAFLSEWQDWLGRRMSDLGGADCPRYLAGLTAFDLGEAQIALAQPVAVPAETV